MNHMEEIAKMLGVELYENFHVKLDQGITLESDYRFTEKGLMRYHRFIEEWDFAIYDTFLHLLDGKYKVVKLPRDILTKQEIELHRKTYEQLQETVVELANENYVLSKALDGACEILRGHIECYDCPTRGQCVIPHSQYFKNCPWNSVDTIREYLLEL